MSQISDQENNAVVLTVNSGGKSNVVLVCEHASHHIPDMYDGLGLSADALQSHAAWDPGAMAVAGHLSKMLDAVLVAGGVSRLVYDCNRPPYAPDAMPDRSEVIDVPGNKDLSAADRAGRVAHVYTPFRAAVAEVMAKTPDPILITIHSFTPVYHGAQRAVEIGVLNDTDTRVADAMLAVATDHTQASVQRNEPYGPANGVTHTLQEHAISHGHPNVMLEIRNDLIATDAQQKDIAQMLAGWIADACLRLEDEKGAQCLA